MSNVIRNLLFQPTFSPSAAAILASGIRAMQSLPTTTDLEQWKADVGAQQMTIIARSGLQTAMAIFRFSPYGFIVLGEGVQNAQQFLAYLTMAAMEIHADMSGKVSGFISDNYDSTKTAVLAAIEASQSLSGTPIVFAGHSAGGSLIQAHANALIKGSQTRWDCKGIYLFGSPKAGNRSFNNGLGNARFVANIRNEDDLIPTFPSDRLVGVINAYDPLAQLNEININRSQFEAAGTKYQLTPQSVGVVSNHLAGTRNQLERFLQVISGGGIPQDHFLSSYVVNLSNNSSAGGDVDLPVETRNQVDTTVGHQQQANPTISQQGSGSIPTITTEVANTPIISGGSNAVAPFFVRAYGQGMATSPSGESSGSRAKAGNGRVKRQVLQIIKLIDQIEAHDARAASGKKSGTVFLRNPARWSASDEAALIQLYNTLGTYANAE